MSLVKDKSWTGTGQEDKEGADKDKGETQDTSCFVFICFLVLLSTLSLFYFLVLYK